MSAVARRRPDAIDTAHAAGAAEELDMLSLNDSRLSLDLDLLDALEKGESKDLLSDNFAQPVSVAKDWETMFVHRRGDSFFLCDSEFGDAVVMLSAVVSSHNRILLSGYADFPIVHGAARSPAAGDVEAAFSNDRCCAVLEGDEAGRRWTLCSTRCELCDGALSKYSCGCAGSPGTPRSPARSPTRSRSKVSPGRKAFDDAASATADGPPMRQVLARVRHCATRVKGLAGLVQQVHVTIPGVDTKTGRRTVWCPRRHRERRLARSLSHHAMSSAGALAKALVSRHSAPAGSSDWCRSSVDSSSSDDSGDSGAMGLERKGDEDELELEPNATSFSSQLPTLTKKDGQSVLTLNFAVSRAMMHSANNFLLMSMPSASGDRVSHLQFGRLQGDVYMLMFNHPMSAVQAFGVALSTFTWAE